MKKFNLMLLLVFALVLSACGGGKVDDNSTNERLAETMFSAIKYNDVELYKKYFETMEDVEWKVANWEGFNGDYSRRFHERMGDKHAELLERIRSEFKQNGFTDWDNAEFDMLTFQEADNSGHKLSRFNKVVFTDGDNGRGTISFTLMYENDNGWVISTFPEFSNYAKF